MITFSLGAVNCTISATYIISILSVKVWGYLDQRLNAALLRRQTPLPSGKTVIVWRGIARYRENGS
jgi:hypothetical protein